MLIINMPDILNKSIPLHKVKKFFISSPPFIIECVDVRKKEGALSASLLLLNILQIL